jgi:hypothetical protein
VSAAQLGLAVVTATMADDDPTVLDLLDGADRADLGAALAWAAAYIGERWERDAQEMGLEPSEWLQRQGAHLAAIIERDGL